MPDRVWRDRVRGDIEIEPLVKDGEPISMDAKKRTITLDLPEAEIAKRRKAWKRPAARYTRGVLAKYAVLVKSASQGAVTDKDLQP